jgi:AcrR family transcriptional regulator
MPTNTFFKLKAEKREKITTLALYAFATQDFEVVSISRLMQDLAMPKGSFYQYFEDKRDLYFYLFEHLQQKKDAHLASLVGGRQGKFLGKLGGVACGRNSIPRSKPDRMEFLAQCLQGAQLACAGQSTGTHSGQNSTTVLG